MQLRARTTLPLLAIILLLGSCESGPPRGVMCEIGEATVTDGYRRLAVIVGVGDYADEHIPDLSGTTHDAVRMYDLLTDTYEFPEENVCLLVEKAATRANFEQAFQSALVDRARPDDVAVVFFAGHGSQRTDRNGDEPDQWDETFVFHDSDGWGAGELIDDDFHVMLQRLHERTTNIVAIIDSCNSGTATRGSSDLQARFLPRSRTSSASIEPGGVRGDAGEGWAPDGLPGLVALTAARDGTPALETVQSGIFTDAVIQVLSQPRSGPFTYAQLARQVPPLVAAFSYQLPYFQGDLDKPVFGHRQGTQPRAWRVDGLNPIEITGPPMIGVDPGAEFRIYDGALTGADLNDPATSKATVVVTRSTGLNARAVLDSKPAAAAPIALGDLAVLVRVGDQANKIRVAIRHPDRPGGVPAERAEALRAGIAANPEAAAVVELVAAGDQYEISVNEKDQLMLRGPENRIRVEYQNDAAVPRNLWQHARQRALLKLRGEGGSDFVDQSTLQVQVVPAPDSAQLPCADGDWQQQEPFDEQLIPLCHSWRIKVKLSESSPYPVFAGAVVLFGDGSTYGFPFDGRPVPLNPGEETEFDAQAETITALPPLDVQEHVLVFGTRESNPVPWHLMTEAASVRGSLQTSLGRALSDYLTPGRRGGKPRESLVEDTTWTMSTLSMRVEANSRFAKRGADGDAPNIREYTLANFDIAPYLPANRDTALYGVLRQAEWLAGASRTSGFSYEQHDWRHGSDAENLAVGIDCSRAIWFAFTRSGFDYNRDNKYLATAQMVGDETLMRDEFDECPADDGYRLGDVLVYRSDVRNDGHVVMVIDAEKRVAWGSHGWDGNARESNYVIEPETGVQYQRIKYKTDWERWDRQDMELKRCWRYRRFSEERQLGIDKPDLPSSNALCTTSRCAL